MTDSDRIESNLLELFRHFARARETGEIEELPGVSVASCGATFHMFNAAFLSDPVSSATDLERRILAASGYFGSRGLRWAFWVREDKLDPVSLQKAPALSRVHGLGLASRMPAMMNSRLAPIERPLPELEIRRVTDAGGRAAFCHILAIAFSIPYPWCHELYGLESVWRGGFSGYIGYADGDPVTTAATMIASGAAGLYCVATLPGEEGKGCAETIIRHAVEAARAESGLDLSVLQSSAAGLPLYYRLGYNVVTRFAVYST